MQQKSEKLVALGNNARHMAHDRRSLNILRPQQEQGKGGVAREGSDLTAISGVRIPQILSRELLFPQRSRSKLQ